MENQIKILSEKELAIEIKRLRYSDQKLYLVKLIKEQTGLGLKEAANMVNEYWTKPTTLLKQTLIIIKAKCVCKDKNNYQATAPYQHQLIETIEVEACRGEYAKVKLRETTIQDAGILSLEDSAGNYISAILDKKCLRILRTKITEILNLPFTDIEP